MLSIKKTQHKGNSASSIIIISVLFLVFYYCAECRVFIAMLSVITMNVVVQSAIILNVIMQDVAIEQHVLDTNAGKQLSEATTDG